MSAQLIADLKKLAAGLRADGVEAEDMLGYSRGMAFACRHAATEIDVVLAMEEARRARDGESAVISCGTCNTIHDTCVICMEELKVVLK